MMNAMPILPKQIPCVCIMYYMANKDDSDFDSAVPTAAAATWQLTKTQEWGAFSRNTQRRL